MLSVLVDTSVWIDHFRRRNEALVELIGEDRGITHPMIVLEIACGTPPAPRARTLQYLSLLQNCNPASLDEQIQQLRVEQMEELGEALLDFSSMQDLTDWLENH